MLLTITSKGISQNIKKDSITLAKTTLISMAKESQKCDSLKVAYQSKSIALNNLINTNTSIFENLVQERKKVGELDKRLEAVNKEKEKLLKKRKSKPLLLAGIGVAGIITGILITK